MKRWFPLCFIFVFGGFLYYILEVLWRGYSHWSMILAGGSCFLAVDCLNEKLQRKTPLWVRCTLGAAVITTIEFIVGCFVNIWAQWQVWDYSRFQFQFMGQICLIYTLVWFFLTAPLLWLAKSIRLNLEKIIEKGAKR